MAELRASSRLSFPRRSLKLLQFFDVALYTTKYDLIEYFVTPVADDCLGGQAAGPRVGRPSRGLRYLPHLVAQRI